MVPSKYKHNPSRIKLFHSATIFVRPSGRFFSAVILKLVSKEIFKWVWPACLWRMLETSVMKEKSFKIYD